jgi:hypothetical protein
MKTDEELKERLRRAGGLVRPLEDPLESLRRHRAAKRRRERLLSAAIGMLMVAGILGGGLAVLHGLHDDGAGPERSGPGASGLVINPGQYFYLKQIEIAGPGGDGSRTEQETWWAPDGSGQLRFGTNRPEKYVPYPPEGVYGKGEFPLPWQSDLSSLSTDPSVLGQQLRERSGADGGSPAPEFASEGEFASDGAGPPTTGRMLAAIRHLLDLPQALPDLREALFQVAADLPGVERKDDVEDPLGRNAVALELTHDGVGGHWVLFFDPENHQLMAESEARSDLGTVYPFMLFESGIVDARGAEPSDDQLLFPRLGRTPDPAPPASPSVP